MIMVGEGEEDNDMWAYSQHDCMFVELKNWNMPNTYNSFKFFWS